MDMLFFLGGLLALAGLAYGAWLCFLHAGEFDEESLRADIAASRAARARGHAETIVGCRGNDQAGRNSIALTMSP